jgi:hypothetical protein
MADYGNNNDNYYPNNNYDNSAPQSNWEASGMNYDEYMELKEMEYQKRQAELAALERRRVETRERIKGMSKNIIAAKMVTSARGPGPKAKVAAAAPPAPSAGAGSLLYHLTRGAAGVPSPALAAPAAAAAPVLAEPAPLPPRGGAGAPPAGSAVNALMARLRSVSTAPAAAAAPAPPVAPLPENTSELARLPNGIRSKIASFLTGSERNNNFKTLRNKIKTEKTKLRKRRATRSRK